MFENTGPTFFRAEIVEPQVAWGDARAKASASLIHFRARMAVDARRRDPGWTVHAGLLGIRLEHFERGGFPENADASIASRPIGRSQSRHPECVAHARRASRPPSGTLPQRWPSPRCRATTHRVRENAASPIHSPFPGRHIRPGGQPSAPAAGAIVGCDYCGETVLRRSYIWDLVHLRAVQRCAPRQTTSSACADTIGRTEVISA